MDLRELRYFAAVAETGSFSRAAIKLGIAQPTLSRQIQNLEQELKSALFYRHGRGIALTEVGAKLHSALSPMLQQFDQVQREIIDQANTPSGLVRLGIPPSIGSTIVAPLAETFRAECSAVHLHVVEAFSGTLFEWVESGAIDLGILYDSRRSHSMNVIPLLQEELYLIDSPGDACAASVASLEEVRLDRLVLPGTGHGLRRVVDAMFHNAGIKVELAVEIDSVPALKQLVEMGAAQTILPFGAVHREVKEKRLVARPFAAGDLRATLVLATALHRPVTKATRQLVQIIQDQIVRHVDSGILCGTPSKLAPIKV
ncbi:LysR family transcriptional regulator [Xanthobacter autotrophicus DSM 431]|uniref:LysR family transcriptional regulator n=1 Tax=Xanthobacter nonsaccharivorans TaxID=3119912 RepID=UPI003726C147